MLGFGSGGNVQMGGVHSPMVDLIRQLQRQPGIPANVNDWLIKNMQVGHGLRINFLVICFINLLLKFFAI